MGNLLNAELYKIIHRSTIGICLVFTVVIEFVNGFLHGGNQIGTLTLLIEIIGLVSCALFAGLFTCADFSSRTIFHAVTSGKNRISVWFSRYLTFLITSFILLLVNQFAVFASFLLFHGIDRILTINELLSIALYTVSGIIYDLCLVSFFFFVAMQVRESGVSIAVSVVLTGIMISSSGILWVDRIFPLPNPRSILNSIPISSLCPVLLLTLLLILSNVLLFQKRDILS